MARGIPSVALALLALATAGCIGGSQPVEPAEAPPPAAWVPGCGDLCDVVTAEQRGSEAHVAIDPSDPDRVLVAANEGRGIFVPGIQGPGWSALGVRRSEDGGSTWTHVPIPVATEAPPGSAWSRFCVTADPVLAWDTDGTAYLSGLGWPCTNGGVPPRVVPGQPTPTLLFPSQTSVGHVWVARSADGGATWGEPSIVTSSPGIQEWPDKEWLAVEPGTGRLVVAWVGLQPQGMVLRWATSEDGGATWPTNGVFVPPSGATFYAPAAVFGADGAVHVAYRACGGGCVEVATRTDGAEDWQHVEVAQVEDTEAPQRFGLPAMAYDAATRTLAMAWHGDGGAGDADAFVATSADGGATWSAPVRLHAATAGHQYMPALAAAGGKVHAFHYDLQGEGEARALQAWYSVLDLATGQVLEAPASEPAPLPEGAFEFMGDYQGAAAAPGRAALSFTLPQDGAMRTVRASVFLGPV